MELSSPAERLRITSSHGGGGTKGRSFTVISWEPSQIDAQLEHNDISQVLEQLE
jgi:hypothetical protein